MTLEISKTTRNIKKVSIKFLSGYQIYLKSVFSFNGTKITIYLCYSFEGNNNDHLLKPDDFKVIQSHNYNWTHEKVISKLHLIINKLKCHEKLTI